MTRNLVVVNKPGPRLPVACWAYDIGVAMDAHASLNITHPHFLADPEELWFYCIHEVHHSGPMQLHPMPRVTDIDSVRELYEFDRYATFLEGLECLRCSTANTMMAGGKPTIVNT